MNKDISKAIMDHARLRHKSLRSQAIEDRKAYNKQRNYYLEIIIIISSSRVISSRRETGKCDTCA